MCKKLSLHKLGIASAIFALLLTTGPAVSQTHNPNSFSRPNPAAGPGKMTGPTHQPNRAPVNQARPATTTARPQSQATIYNNHSQNEGHQSWQGHHQGQGSYNPGRPHGYSAPSYPGPNVPLPAQGTYYVPNPYYGYGYGYSNYNAGATYQYNGSTYTNDYQYHPGPNVNNGFPTFQHY